MATPVERAESDAGKPAHAGPYVVAIGASAGGLSALQALLGFMPPEPGFSCVIVVHLSPEHESYMPKLLQTRTTMPVLQVTSTTALLPNHIYVIPPNANLNAIDTHLRLSQLETRRAERAPIDHFLRTLASTHDGGAIAVILTGAGSDGSIGLRQIKENGGLTIAQDPAEAEFDSMPRNAIATGMVDLVLPLRRIVDEIVRFCATEPEMPLADGDDELEPDVSNQLTRIIDELRACTRYDFGVYRKATLLKRLRRRMRLHHVSTLDAYLDVLSHASGEAESLADDLQFQPTEFFRDAEIYRELEQSLLPRLLRAKSPDDQRLRAWSIGCSTGEEAYSLGMLFIELNERQESALREMQVFATDTSHKVLTQARLASYPHEIAATVSPERLARFFTHENGYLRVRRELRDVVVFAPHDLFEDPPFAHLDLIVCQTLLHDLQPDVLRGVLRLFHYALEPGGILLVGPDDVVDAPDLFASVDGSPRFLRRLAGTSDLKGLPLALSPFRKVFGRQGLINVTPADEPPRDIAVIHRLAIERYAPPSVLVDSMNTVVYFSRDVADYLQLPGGELTHDITRLVKEPLLTYLLDGLRAAWRVPAPWSSAPLVVRTYHGLRRLVLRIERLANGLTLIVFDDRRDEASVADSATEAIERLGAELERVRAQIPSPGAATSSLQEHSVATRKLHDLAEDLASSREEQQAVHEELRALDHENRRRINELNQISTDLHHLLASTGIATLFLDRDLKIVRFTPLLARLFNLKHSDIGRPLTDLQLSRGGGFTEEDASRALQTLETVEREVHVGERWYLSRILPYRTENERVEGVVATLIDITERKQAEMALVESELRFRQFSEAASGVLWTRDASTLSMDYVSAAALKVFGVDKDALLGDVKRWAALILPEDRDAALEHLDRARRGQATVQEYRLQRPDDLSFRWIRDTAFPLRNASNEVERIGGIAEDITEARLALEHQGVLLSELQHRVRNIMAIIHAIAVRTGERADSVREYADLMAGRVLALARVQALLTRAPEATVKIATLVEEEVGALAQHRGQYHFEGADVALSPKAAEILTLVVHELATNAIKYGALSVPEGKVDVRWAPFNRNGQARLKFDWTESGAPASSTATAGGPRRRGFGTELIEARLPYELDGCGSIEITPGGAHCHLEFPLQSGPSVLETGAPQGISVVGGSLDMSAEPSLNGYRVLIAEDDFYLAADAARALRGAGAEVLGPYPTEPSARAELQRQPPDAAVLDVNLGGGPTFGLADSLTQAGIPFVFVTGYDHSAIPEKFSRVPRLQKPVPLPQIIQAVAGMLAAVL